MSDQDREIREALAPLRDSVEAALRKAIDRREDFDATVDRLTLAAAGHIVPPTVAVPLQLADAPLATVTPLRSRRAAEVSSGA